MADISQWENHLDTGILKVWRVKVTKENGRYSMFPLLKPSILIFIPYLVAVLTITASSITSCVCWMCICHKIKWPGCVDANNFWFSAVQSKAATIPDMKMREGSITSSVSLTFWKWLFHILINKQSNLSSTLCPVNWKLFEGKYETHIHYGRTYFLPLITTKSNNISVCPLSHM